MKRTTDFVFFLLLLLPLANYSLAFISTSVKHTATSSIQHDSYKRSSSNSHKYRTIPSHNGYHYFANQIGNKQYHDGPLHTSSFPLLGMISEEQSIVQSGCSSIWQAVEVFDGSSIVDPVVVSTVFWSSLKTKIVSILIGQLVATAVVGLLTFIFSTQLVAFGNYVSKQIFSSKEGGDSSSSVRERKELNANPIIPSPKITPNIGKLLLCLLIDIVGTSSEFIPLVGELSDFAYAPFAAFALRYLFQGSNVIFALEFVEEFLPFTDILPLATLCWILETYFANSDIAKLLQIGTTNSSSQIMTKQNNGTERQRNGRGDNIIDAEVKVIRDE
mmetsp:Transcript_16137/g.30485  ORF Transcript_16137/g.30485 Transcript_16137/m.30485 type:complete len:331 (-) Transcript_16137:1384-2376(-)